jgi:Type II secretion system (T2SS), protein G
MIRAAKVLSILSSARACLRASASSRRLMESLRRTPLKRRRPGFAQAACAVVIGLSLATSVCAKGELGAKEARRLITRLGGAQLSSGAVHIKSITPGGAGESVALAEIETAFRLESGGDGRWRVAEVRTGSDRWEDLSLITQAARGERASASVETGAAQEGQPRAATLDARLAREVLALFIGVRLPSDAVRVKEVSALYNSAVVVAQVWAEFRFQKGSDNKWRVTHLRAGEGEWTDVELIVRALNREKAGRARSELEMMAAALDSFRRVRGFYVVAETTGALVDQLNPEYLARVLRLDPWHQPYLYEGERDRYVLRSAGGDGEPGTADDIEVRGHAPGGGN